MVGLTWGVSVQRPTEVPRSIPESHSFSSREQIGRLGFVKMAFNAGADIAATLATIDLSGPPSPKLEPFNPNTTAFAASGPARNPSINWDEELAEWDKEIQWDSDIVDGDILSSNLVGVM